MTKEEARESSRSAARKRYRKARKAARRAAEASSQATSGDFDDQAAVDAVGSTSTEQFGRQIAPKESVGRTLGDCKDVHDFSNLLKKHAEDLLGGNTEQIMGVSSAFLANMMLDDGVSQPSRMRACGMLQRNIKMYFDTVKASGQMLAVSKQLGEFAVDDEDTIDSTAKPVEEVFIGLLDSARTESEVDALVALIKRQGIEFDEESID